MTAKHPLHYHFGEVTELFHYIYEVCETAGIYIDWSGTAQTVQLYRSKESFYPENATSERFSMREAISFKKDGLLPSV